MCDGVWGERCGVRFFLWSPSRIPTRIFFSDPHPILFLFYFFYKKAIIFYSDYVENKKSPWGSEKKIRVGIRDGDPRKNSVKGACDFLFLYSFLLGPWSAVFCPRLFSFFKTSLYIFSYVWKRVWIKYDRHTTRSIST